MPPKYSAAVLSVVALSAWSASSMATAGSLLQNFMPSSYVSGETNAPHVQVSSNQRSESNADLTARNITDEERARQPLSMSGNGPEGMMRILQNRFRYLIDQRQYFSSWIQNKNYGNLKKLNPKAINHVMPTLVNLFKDQLASVLLAESKMDGARKELAEALLDKMTTVWKNDNTYNPKNVFEILELDEANGNLFEHPHFFIWVRYVKLKYRNLNEAYETMFATLKPFYQGDDLCTVLAARAEVKNREDIASALLSIQLKEWKQQGKSAMDVLTLLKLEDNLFESPLFSKWRYYISIGTRSKVQAAAKMYPVLRKVYGNRLAGLLQESKITSVERIAPELLKLDVAWETKAQGAIKRFMELGLKRTQGNLFGSPIYSKWLGNVKWMFPKDTPMHTSAILQQLFSHDELVGVFLLGVSDENTKSAVIKLIPNQSYKEAMVNELFGV